jgi:hypothetical protein
MDARSAEAALCRHRAKKLKKLAAGAPDSSTKAMMLSAAKDLSRKAVDARSGKSGHDDLLPSVSDV